MNEEPESHPPVTPLKLEVFKALLDVGRKLCSDGTHGPHQDPIGLHGRPKDSWVICLLTLPKKSGIQFKTHRLGMITGVNERVVIQEDAPGHKFVCVESTDVSQKYFNDLLKQHSYDKTQKDPNNYLVPIPRAFIRMDIAKFSQYPVRLQPLVLADIQQAADEAINDHKTTGSTVVEEILHTGDGFILVYAWPGNAEDGWLLKTAGAIASALDRRNDDRNRLQIHFRMSVTLGDVYFTHDLRGRRNYVGEPLTDAERLIACMPSNVDDLVYFSDPVYRAFRHHVEDRFTRLGSVSDKHGNHHRVYSLEYVKYPG